MQHHERFVTVQDRAGTRITCTVEHSVVGVQRQEWRNTDCAVVTMALVSDFSHPESIILLKAILTDSVQGKLLLVELFQRHFATCIIRSPLPHHHDRSLLLCHCIRRNLLHPLRGSHGVFLPDLFRVRHDNAFLCPSRPHRHQL